jgi:hypothetical protein
MAETKVRPSVEHPVSLTGNPRVSLPGTLPRLLNALSAEPTVSSSASGIQEGRGQAIFGGRYGHHAGRVCGHGRGSRVRASPAQPMARGYIRGLKRSSIVPCGLRAADAPRSDRGVAGLVRGRHGNARGGGRLDGLEERRHRRSIRPGCRARSRCLSCSFANAVRGLLPAERRQRESGAERAPLSAAGRSALNLLSAPPRPAPVRSDKERNARSIRHVGPP